MKVEAKTVKVTMAHHVDSIEVLNASAAKTEKIAKVPMAEHVENIVHVPEESEAAKGLGKTGAFLPGPLGACSQPEAQVEGCSEVPSAAAQEVQGLDEATVALFESFDQKARATGFGGHGWDQVLAAMRRAAAADTDSFAPCKAMVMELLAAVSSEG